MFANLTGAEMKTAFEEIVKSKMDDTLFYQVLALAKAEIEMERPWQILQELDTSQTIGASHVYTTAKTLPTRFLTPISIFVGDDRVQYIQIPFSERERYQDTAHRWYLKRKDSTFFICGKPESGKTINFFFVKSSVDISSTTTWEFPDWAHLLLPIKAAKLHYPIDTGEKGRSWDDRWLVQENRIRRALLMWDARMAKEANRHSKRGIDYSSHPNIVG